MISMYFMAVSFFQKSEIEVLAERSHVMTVL
jgi:hypothetical protein